MQNDNCNSPRKDLNRPEWFSKTRDCYVNQTDNLVGKDKESEAELSINSLSFHCFCPPKCQSKSHALESHLAVNLSTF